uniref:Calreticulin n=1 Tax=Arion vulgaris TaxID=1028688 RepID=A0A0B7AX06_9EUPU
MRSLALFLLLGIAYADPTIYFSEEFDDGDGYLNRWFTSKHNSEPGVFRLTAGSFYGDAEKDKGLQTSQDARFYGISAKFDKFSNEGKTLVVQFTVKHEQSIDCGGGYVKLFSSDLDHTDMHGDTPYNIMFGPDICGPGTKKVHVIFNYKGKNLLVKKDIRCSDDIYTHLYTLIVKPDNTYEVKIDNEKVESGNLEDDWDFLLSKKIPDPNAKKPEGWDDREEIDDTTDTKPEDWDKPEHIPDPEAKKPDDWDESEPSAIVDEDAVKPDGWLEDEEVYIPDPAAVKPEDWDDEMDGEWEAPRIDNPKCKDGPGCGKWEKPTIANPKYKGTWRPPTIDNPNYKGEWKPRRISNPDYFEDANPYQMTPIDALGLELWSMTDDIVFDNFIISDNATIVEEFTAITWETKNIQEKSSSSAGQSIIQAIKDATNERPWLWAVFILVVVLPIVLIITYCCTGTSKPEDIDAHKKKFDDPTPDSPEVIEEEEEDAVKEDEEKEEIGKDEGAGGDQEDAGVGNTVEAGAAGDGSPAEDQADEGDDERDAEGSPKKSNSPRKRRTRKE